MRAVLLLNPRAGTLLARPDLLRSLPEALRAAGLELLPLPGPADAELDARLEAALALGPAVVVVGGGDGSIRAAAARLAGGPVALGVLPLGTLNLLARDLGIPLEPEEAAKALHGAVIREIDMGEVNGEVFLCQSVIGLPNRMGLHRERVRGRDGMAARWRVAVGLLRAWWRYPPQRLGLRVGGAPMKRVWTRALSVVNNEYAEAPGRIFHRARLDGGVLALHAARDFGLWWALRLVAAMAMGRWRHGTTMVSGSAPEIAIHSRHGHVRVMNDGEAMLLSTPLHYTSRPRAMRVLAPPPAPAGLEPAA